jgi:hypothetical protein
MATTDQLTAWLAEAEQALHELNIGRRAVSISSSSGKSVSFTAADVGKLQTYIDSLRRQLGIKPTVLPLRFRIG